MATAAVAAVGVVTSVMSARKARKGAKGASKAQQEAAERAQALTEERYQDAKGYLSPYRTGGQAAFDMTQALSGALGPEAQAQAYANYQESPGVQFQREQGMRGIEQDRAVSGMGGGSRLKALSRFNQGLAMQDFGSQFTRLQNQGNQGLAASQSLAGFGANAAAASGAQLQDAAAARAGGMLAQAKAQQQMIGSLGKVAGNTIAQVWGK